MHCPHCFKEINPAKMLRAIESKKRSEQSRLNGKKGGRHKKNCTCEKHEIIGNIFTNATH